MKKAVYFVLALALSWVLMMVFYSHEAEWGGIDETIVGKIAEEAGRPPADPYINVAQGDLLLFAFLLAGALGGFVLGFYFHKLFTSNSDTEPGELGR